MSKEQSITPSKNECKCYLCLNKEKIIGKKRVPWTIICKYILKALAFINEKQYYSAHDDIYPFVIEHWNILGELTQFKNGKSWKKALLDAMNHSGQFESGPTKKRIGLWKLKSSFENIDNKENSNKEKKPKKNLLKYSSRRKELSEKCLKNEILLSDTPLETFQDINQTNNLNNEFIYPQILTPSNISISNQPKISHSNMSALPLALMNDLQPLYHQLYHSVYKSIKLLNKRRKQMKLQFNSSQRILSLIARLQFDMMEKETYPSSFLLLKIL
ncbi:hypothetical protein EHI8A_076000 [Entamoeba histolytica HM-1:IMSS-B]|uniref:Uncharacterized protein n=6 Tax=Entamoeba histolytica TaxID=5759 RepID=C4M5Y3_ENTH1|nr:hypothetical protein EHI_137240 [Entamoeba histolytica HM-1:IMSS]EMD46671.1 Hypothetical protein EHI5A_110500 [Entamoeba histolytica KU27]EMH72813.1 hypothetical protein EHI8A_076000 [Entamoeba histolytica HM-1:IMSS-B]EMS16450.1 hypothetical protein KM1_108640 [Entamoeba histolytica HM-3:IMSS]ENY62149.1 hypothetical protein EHI7A_073820 [Entamoeba histolytica HM-1:IMSS-A]GAT96858.1 hypothetical protein CL6EHI_137240 [Entamoeba histolytica]|eukprot:XP_653852.1 hypothetical protein EHI_137240 [Entamoeba histolytica HM-1:IMSS]